MRNKRDRNSGFTLVEALVTVAILVILLSVSAVGVAQSGDHLKITELDNAAWEIYMAAQNRAVLLQNSGRAPSAALPKSADPVPSDPIIVSNGDTVLDELLPVGSIDPTLREEGHFRVLYDGKTGHVREVFYAEEVIGDDLDHFRRSPSERISEFRAGTTSQLVGYYGDTEAGPGDTGARFLPTPGVEVLIDNGEELTLNVKYTLPDSLPGEVTYTPTVLLEYNTKSIELSTGGPRFSSDGSFEGGTVTYTWVLDSLKKDDTGNSRQFKDLSGDFTGLGGDFTVTAGLTLSAEGYFSSARYATGRGNSLFAEDSTYDSENGVAKIKNLRHLQNLCTEFSGVGEGVVKAEQLADVECDKYKGENYTFIPIKNAKLMSYDGREREIRDLRVAAAGNAGLFGEVACAGMSISGVRLVAPDVTSTERNAGGLVGLISQNCAISDCRVYWKDARELVAGRNYSYKIQATAAGMSAGGLAGVVNARVTIKQSFATAAVSGGASGGLIGRVSSGSTTITHSYADCYLKADGAAAGGLVGTNNGNVTLTNCYAAGFIIEGTGSGGTTGGLVGDGGATASGGVYSVARVVKDGKLKKPTRLLAQGLQNREGTRYLFTTADAEEAFSSAPFHTFPFKKVKGEDTHVYNLRYETGGAADKCVPPYPFPGLTGLPHYGDWAELKVAVGLAYYEQYEDSVGAVNYGFDGMILQKAEDGTDAAAHIGSGSLKNLTVAKDGYALAVRTGDLENLTNVRIAYGEGGGQMWTLTPLEGAASTEWKWAQDGTTSSVEQSAIITEGGAAVSYTLIPLPDEVVAGDLPTSDFYQKLTVRANTKEEPGGSDGDSKDYYFNPHFAKTVKGSTKPNEPDNSETSAISIRSPRHLYDLTRRHNGDLYYYNEGFYFKQELDLDYSAYRFPTGAGPERKESEDGGIYYQQPLIGTETAPFKGAYDGGGHSISDVAAAGAVTEPIPGQCPLFGTVEGELTGIDYDFLTSLPDAEP